MPPPVSYWAAIGTATASVRTETPTATSFGSAEPGRLGRNATRSAPTSGTATRTVSQGMVLMRGPRGIGSGASDFVGCSCDVHRQEGQDDEQDAAEQGQGIGAHEAVLDAAQLAGDRTDGDRA